MARPSDKERVAEWQRKIDSADKVYKEWEDKYQPNRLYNYFLGHQWRSEEKDNYTINLVFPTIETQMPAQLFYHPRVIVKPRPTYADDVASTAVERAALQQDTLNTFLADPRIGFKEAIEEAQLEAYFRFGLVEVGYSADFIDNPNAGKPILTERTDAQGNPLPLADADGPVLQADANLRYECLYFKCIPASNFRVSVNAKRRLNQCDWFGYYEWHYPSDLKKNRRYRNTTSISTTGALSNRYAGDMPERPDAGEREGMAKVWKIWDLRGKMRLDFAEGNGKFFLEEKLDLWRDGSPVIPIVPLAPHRRLHEFLPLPACYNWISPQDELNESRQMLRNNRRKLIGKYYAKDNVEQAEVDKFIEPVIQVVRVSAADDIGPIANPASDGATIRSIPESRNDFREISGTSGEERGIAEADTATQANIINVNSRIRESRSRVRVADWLGEICTVALWMLRNRMTLPFWIERNVDPLGPGATVESMKVAALWQQITAEQLGDLGDVMVDVDSIASTSEAGDRQDWIAALTFLGTPAGMLVMASEPLLRKTMAYFNVRSESDLRAIRQVAMLMAMGQAQAQAGAAIGAKGSPAPGETPTNAAISGDQLAAQLGPQTIV